MYETFKEKIVSFISKQIQWLQFIFPDFGTELMSVCHPVFLKWSVQVFLRPLAVSMKIPDVTRARPDSRPLVMSQPHQIAKNTTQVLSPLASSFHAATWLLGSCL